MAAKWSILDRFGMLFGTPYSIKFRDLLNLLNCNKYNEKTSVSLIKAPSFRIHFPHNFMFFQAPLLVAIFDKLCLFCLKMTIVEPLQNPVGAKMVSKIEQVAPKCSKF